MDTRHAIAQNKVMVFDGQAVATGSFNFTKGGEEHNAENLIILNSLELAKLYIEEVQRLRAQAVEW